MDDNDDADASSAPEAEPDDTPTDGGILDQFDEAITNADATGMVAGERLITQAEIQTGLDGDR
jgi:hypothetical protein